MAEKMKKNDDKKKMKEKVGKKKDAKKGRDCP